MQIRSQSWSFHNPLSTTKEPVIADGAPTARQSSVSGVSFGAILWGSLEDTARRDPSRDPKLGHHPVGHLECEAVLPLVSRPPPSI